MQEKPPRENTAIMLEKENLYNAENETKTARKKLLSQALLEQAYFISICIPCMDLTFCIIWFFMFSVLVH